MGSIEAYLLNKHEVEVVFDKDYYNGNLGNCFVHIDGKNIKLSVVDNMKHDRFIQLILKSEEELLYYKKMFFIFANGVRKPLIVDKVSKSRSFDVENYYSGNDLGPSYTKEQTTFKVWAPTAYHMQVEINNSGETTLRNMKRTDNGVWVYTKKGDLELAVYRYFVHVNGVITPTLDPYAYTSTPNTEYSVIIDLNKITAAKPINDIYKLESSVQSIVYELHVRDFSIAESSNIKNKGKFLGVVEEGVKTNNGYSSGLDYLKDLGVTHIQFLPVFDYGSVDEVNTDDFYNWGYDPVNYNVPEGSYTTDVNDPYKRVNELIEMNNKLHESGIRTIMDVVYNHVFDRNENALYKLVPGYYFRYDTFFFPSNGSYCGNDFESNSRMGRKFIIDSCKRWINMYGFDGLRFDLMGILDIETMNQLRDMLDDIDETILVYGEGWNMPTTLHGDLRATIQNTYQMEDIGHFNDKFRNTVKELCAGSVNIKTEEVEDIGELFFTCMVGCANSTGKNKPYINKITNSVNYVECHDNHTYFDFLKYEKGTNVQEIEVRHRNATALTIFAQGITFIHAGQEFYRTKDGVENSYMSDDSINKFDWNRKDNCIDDVRYFSKIVNIKRQLAEFYYSTNPAVIENTKFKMIFGQVAKVTYMSDTRILNIYTNFSQFECWLHDDINNIIVNSRDMYADMENMVSTNVIPPLTTVVSIEDIS